MDILGDTIKEKEAYGHVTLGRKPNGKEFLAKYAYNEGYYRVFITKTGNVIKNRRDLMESLKVVV